MSPREPVLLDDPLGPGHRLARRAGLTACGKPAARMLAADLLGCAVFGVALCLECWPEQAIAPGWPLKLLRRHE